MKHLLALVATATLSSALVQADAPSRSSKRTMASDDQKPARPLDDKYGPYLRQGFYMTADFLYWIAHEEGLEYATTGIKGTGNTAASNVTRGSAKDPNFKWKPGFRVGIGWTLPNSYWDFGATWTWYHATAHGSTSHAAPTDTNPLFASLESPFAGSILGASSNLSAASAKWRLCYNVLDVELGRSFFPNKHLSVRPHGGVRGAWLNQKYSNQYTYADATDSAVLSRKLRNNYHAAGFKTGVDSLWHFNRYFGIFANTSVSLLGGNFHIKENDTNTSNTDAAALNNTIIHTKDSLFGVAPVVETAMGFHFMIGPERRHYWFDLNAGWEYAVWFNQNQMPLYVDDIARGTFIRERGNLHLMGFTLNAKLHF